MPNWCSNVLTWDTDEETSNVISAAVSKDLGNGNVCNFSYEAIVPQPPEILESLSKSTAEYFAAHPDEKQDMSWYDWRLENWGCKWDNDNDVDKIDRGVAFQSPWGPPVEIMTPLAEKFPGVQFRLTYDEPGMVFCGECNAYCDEDGDVSIEREQYDASSDAVGYMQFQKGSMDNDDITYNGSVVNVGECYTDTSGKFYLLGWGEVDKDNFDASEFAIEPCEGEDCAQIVHEYYSVESVEWYDDKFTVTALPVEGFDCKYQSLRLDFEYTSNG